VTLLRDLIDIPTSVGEADFVVRASGDADLDRDQLRRLPYGGLPLRRPGHGRAGPGQRRGDLVPRLAGPGHHTVEEMAPPWPPGWLLSRAYALPQEHIGRLTLDPPGVEVLGSTGRMDSCRALGHTLACQAGHQVEVWLVQR
jgi:hypothetical protein